MYKLRRLFNIHILVIIIIFSNSLTACNFMASEENDDELSTSVAGTIVADALQYTIQAQGLQLTAVAQTLTSSQQLLPQPEQTQLPIPPPPQSTSPLQDPSQATTQAVSSLLTSLNINATSSLIFGPSSGSLMHNPTDGSLSYECASLNLQDFMVQVEFMPPYSSSVGDWDFGILFRVQNNGNYRLAMFIGQDWELENYRKATEEFVPISKGEIENLKSNEGDTNLIQIISMGSLGWLLVNDAQSASLDLSAMQDAGDICIAVGFYKNTEITGEETPYSNFTVWELQSDK